MTTTGPINSSNPNEAPVKYPGEVGSERDPVEDYFANKPKEEIGFELQKKADNYYEYLMTSGRWRLYGRSYEYYYNGQQRGARLLKTGEQDEYTAINVNHYRNILQHLLVNTTAQRVKYDPHATNTDYKSQSQTIVSKGVLEYYDRAKRTDRNAEKSLEDCLVYAEGFVHQPWDANEGEDWVQNPNDELRPYKQGDIVTENFTPVDVIRDFTARSYDQCDWVIIRRFVNKWTYAARYPDLAEKILALSLDPAVWKERRIGRPVIQADGDLIPLYVFYHDKTSATPLGREIQYFDAETIIIDSPLAYDKRPLYRTVASEQDNVPFGYTIGWDLLPIQETIDSLYSTITTNQATFGVQNILMPDGANIGVTEIAGGLNLIKYNPKSGKPEPLNLTNTPKEIFSYIQQLEHLMETLSGVNSVTRGNPEASLKSGAALALVASQAIQFNSGLQKTYTRLLEDMGTSVINLLKKFAQTPRIAMITGKAQRPLLKEFKGSDLSEIDRVTVDIGNPLSRTTAGKLQIADSLLEGGHIKNADEYFQILTTGMLEPMIEGQQAQSLLIRAENENLFEGKPVKAIDIDDHRLHIVEHGVVLASPEARSNPKIVESAMMHIMEHVQALQMGNPVLLSLYGQPQVPQGSPPPPGGQPPMGPPPGGPPPPPGTGGKAADAIPGLKPAPGMEGKLPNLPQMPKNAMTDEPYENMTGGLPG